MFRTILTNTPVSGLLLVGLFLSVAAPRSTRASRLSNNRSRHSISIGQFKRTILLGLTIFVAGMVNVTFAQSSVFTYQGRLQDGGAAANGSYDFRFTLWDASSGGAQQPQTSPVTVNLANVPVTAGNFSVQLDFGATAFPGADRFLEMSVQLAGAGPFTTLSPRTKVTGTPYALRSASAANADTVANGSITSAKLASDLTLNGTTTGTFSGPVTGNASTATTAGNVTGVVAIANGGTGSATQNFVDLTMDQTIAGNKTFSNTVNLPTTNAAATVGVINQNGISLIHSFGTNNFFAGAGAGNFTMTGNLNTATGMNALHSNTKGTANTATGMNALLSNTEGISNTASGQNALKLNTTGLNNTANGQGALFSNNGDNNTATGAAALFSNTIGSRNTAIGELALSSNTIGSNNTASGADALQNNTKGGGNTATGMDALFSNTEGSGNTASGISTLKSNTMGNSNTAIGSTALFANTIGSNNTAIGATALHNNTSDANTAIGANALPNNQGGCCNTAIGVSALIFNTMGSLNTAIGREALFNTKGDNNIGVGNGAGGALTGNNNIDIGNQGVAADSGIIRIGMGGVQTDTFLTGIIHGDGSGLTNLPPVAAVNLSTTNAAGTEGVINQNGSSLIHTFGTNNFFAGAGAGNFTMMGVSNTAIGLNALHSNTTGNFNTAIGEGALLSTTEGTGNTASGLNALKSNTTGSNNTANGDVALFSNNGDGNTAIGDQALAASTGSHNIGLGYMAGFILTAGNNNIDIGNLGGFPGESGIIRIGTKGTQNATFIAGIRGVLTGNNNAMPVLIDSDGQLGTSSSSRRYKQDIKDMGSTSSRLMALRPVTFRYLKPYANGEKPIQFGLIAEEVAETFPELVVRNKEGQPETVKYQDLTPLLLNEVQKQAKTIAELQAQATDVANGNTTTNKQGEATVTLPDNFVALNQAFRYQLTVVGQFAQAIVLQEVKSHHFKIKTDKPNVRVSWQVTGMRHGQSAGNQK